MENSPFNIDTDKDSEKKESKSKKKKAGELGAFAVEPKKSKEKPAKLAFEDSFESEHTAPLEHLAKPEKQFAEREFTKAEQAADLEPIDAVERFRNRIIIEGQDSDEALTQTLAELQDLPNAENDPEAGASEEPVAEAPGESEDMPHEFGEEPVLLNEHSASAPEDDSADGLTASTANTSGPTARPTSGGAGRLPMGPAGPISLGGGSHAGFNVAPTAPARSVEHGSRDPFGHALVGGIVGYLIGRRKGRIKTEKRLIPVQKKLQKEVVSLHSQLQQKESKIRALAATKVQENLKPLAEKIPPLKHVNYSERAVDNAPERPVSIVRAPAAEANQLHGKRHAPEQIGHVLVGAESFRQVFNGPGSAENVSSLEKQKPARSEKLLRTEARPEPLISVERNIDTLNRVDLLKLSERIIIDGASLRQIYETRLVGEKGLRRLVKEHLKGGDVKKALRREIVEREIDFERDPGLRDRAPQSAAAPKGGGRAATLNDLLQNAELAVGEDQEEVAFLKARSAYEEFERDQQTSKQRIMDISFITIITCLLGVVVFLIISHR